MDKEVLEAFEQIVSRRVRIDGDCNPAYFTLEELQPSNVAKVRAHLSDPAFVRVPVEPVAFVSERAFRLGVCGTVGWAATPDGVFTRPLFAASQGDSNE